MNKIKVYTIFFFQEIELLKLRLNYLYDYVDFFIIVESAQTFSGNKKNFELEKLKDHYLHFRIK